MWICLVYFNTFKIGEENDMGNSCHKEEEDTFNDKIISIFLDIWYLWNNEVLLSDLPLPHYHQSQDVLDIFWL